MRSNLGIYSRDRDGCRHSVRHYQFVCTKAQSSGIKRALVADNYIESYQSELIANDSVYVSVSVAMAMLTVVLHACLTSKEHAPKLQLNLSRETLDLNDPLPCRTRWNW